MAGLVCARILTRGGFSVRLLEASDGVGGRVRTDEVDGFLLDRGFQVNEGCCILCWCRGVAFFLPFAPCGLRKERYS